MNRWDFILRLKGWQVFLILQAAVIAGSVVALRSDFPFSDSSLEQTGFAVAAASFEFLYFGWMLAVGTAMNLRLPPQLSRGSLFPTLALAVAVSYLFFFGYLFNPDRLEGPFVGILVALHFFSMFVNFFLLWYVSRALVAAEENNKPPLDRVIGVFFVIWFSLCLPIGAWWVQNRAKRVADGGSA